LVGVMIFFSFHKSHARSLTTEVDLNDMPYANGARFTSDKECLPGTRLEILDEIIHWINSTEEVPRVLLLCGATGTGKSAIAHTVAHQFDGLRRLGSSFFFDRAHQAERRLDNVFSTIACDLADLDPLVKQPLVRLVRGNRSLRHTRDLKAQLENFLLQPTQHLTMSGPVVIVIDALDESGDPVSRQTFLSLLAEGITKLPANFRVLLTSRPERDVEDIFGNNDRVICKRMDTIPSTIEDILVYIRTRLADARSGPIDESMCVLLANKSEGLFRWAVAACEAIGGHGRAGLSHLERFQNILSSSPRNSITGPLDDLYSGILSRLFDKDDTIVMARFRSVMGQVLAESGPFSIDSLTKMRQLYIPNGASCEDEVGLVVQSMGSLLIGVNDRYAPIRPLHTSFRDFLMDASRSRDFHIDAADHHPDMAITTFPPTAASASEMPAPKPIVSAFSSPSMEGSSSQSLSTNCVGPAVGLENHDAKGKGKQRDDGLVPLSQAVGPITVFNATTKEAPEVAISRLDGNITELTKKVSSLSASIKEYQVMIWTKLSELSERVDSLVGMTQAPRLIVP
jgi:hypothetical protein